eukprot:CAMPEP_0198703940 /NCGR_PEP_ID=MMETSP1468-20131203/389635_1 /TAXON_ID=1461545 /ORGANISM="Mantoniella sp, Strain CCMP1436" /LENGTH=176 /DNA_ID=CAMNT_0044462715 /DNA_START=2208 /DNA_END=2734 /DNA_ORIENTATION=+
MHVPPLAQRLCARRHQRYVDVRRSQTPLLDLTCEDVVPSSCHNGAANVIRASEPVVGAGAVSLEVFVAPASVMRLDIVRATTVGDVTFALELRRLDPGRWGGSARHAYTVGAVGKRFVNARPVDGAHAGFPRAGDALAPGIDFLYAGLARGGFAGFGLPLEAASGGAGVGSQRQMV